MPAAIILDLFSSSHMTALLFAVITRYPPVHNFHFTYIAPKSYHLLKTRGDKKERRDCNPDRFLFATSDL
jgi:hypothetical protein